MTANNKAVLLILQFFTGYLLQGASFPLFVYAYSKTKFNKSHFIITSVAMTLFIFISRNLNINFGVHTVINLILLIILSMFYNKLPARSSTIGSLLVTVCMILIEILDVGIMMLLLTPEVFKEQAKDPLRNAVFAIPATVALLIVSIIFYYFRTKGISDAEKNN